MVDSSPEDAPRTGGRRGGASLAGACGLFVVAAGLFSLLMTGARWASTIALALTTAATALMVIWTMYYLPGVDGPGNHPGYVGARRAGAVTCIEFQRR